DNASWDWQEANDKLTSLNKFAEDYFEQHVAIIDGSEHEGEEPDIDGWEDEPGVFDFQDEVNKAEELANPFPEGDARDCVRAWLEASNESLRLVEQGLARRRYQVPQENLTAFLSTGNKMEEVPVPRNIAKLKVVLCNESLARGEPALATQHLVDLLKIANMTMYGEGYLVHYMVALGVHRMAMDAVNAFAFSPQITNQSLAKILDFVPQTMPSTQSLARVFRVEVSYYVQHDLPVLPPTADLQQLVDTLIKKYLQLGNDELNEMFTSHEQIDRVRSGMLKLFDRHPQPFDAADTIRIYSESVATMINDLSSPWLQRKQDIAQPWLAEIAAWPEPLSFINDLSFSLSGDEKEERVVTDYELSQAQVKLRQVHNPIGKHMLHYFNTFESIRRAHHIGQLHAEIAGVFIACRMYRDKERRLPDHLSDLVTSGLLPSVPIDPFSGQAVRYDPRRRLIWSFGIDEVDNDGHWDFDAAFPDGDDIVWRIP
ncbi:MAG: hypothetical protein KDA92_25485, partial [Planctomycetales bacterium]|nr:hypothetical protein [Planctomycetales bacterium]